jgi:polar amino acid transport system permease protein/polar amino acid transport system substrate-binding protein
MGELKTLWETFFNWDSMRQAVPDMLTTGLPNTLILSIISALIGTFLGLLLAMAGIAGSRWLRWPARVYTDIFRGLPAVVTILLVGMGLAHLGLKIWGPNPYPLGIFALSLIAAAYIGEIFRAGIQSVDGGQLEASRALGFTYPAAMFLVIIPQGVRRVLPALVNQFIALIKDSSLVYFLGLAASQRELFRIGQDSAATTGNESALVLAGLFYLVLTVPLTHLVNHIDRRLRQGRRITTAPPDGGDGTAGQLAAPPVPGDGRRVMDAG